MKAILMPLTLLGLFLCIATAPSQPPATPPSAKNERLHVTLRAGDAVALAEVLSKHFKGDPEILAVPGANALLLSGSREGNAEAVKLLAQIDRAPRLVEVEIVTADLFGKKNPFEKGDDELNFTGKADVVLARLDALQKNGQLTGIQRYKLSGIDGHASTVITGGNKAIRVGTAGGFGPKGVASYNYQPHGGTLRMTPRIQGEESIAVDLELKESKIKVSDPAGAAGAAGAVADEPAEMTNTTLTTRVAIPSGQAVVAQAVRGETKSGPTITLVIVTARVVEVGK